MVNGNGETFQISFKMDIKKIYKAFIFYKGIVARPTSIDFNDNYAVIGSTKDGSTLFKFETMQNNVLWPKEIAKLPCIGQIVDFFKNSKGGLNLLTNKGIFHLVDDIKFDIIEKFKIETKITNCILEDSYIKLFSNEGYQKFNLQTQELEDQKPIIIQALDNTLNPENIIKTVEYMSTETKTKYKIVFYNENILCIKRGDEILIKFESVSTWSLNSDKLGIVTLKDFVVYSLSQLSVFFYSQNIYNFDEIIYNDLVVFKTGKDNRDNDFEINEKDVLNNNPFCIPEQLHFSSRKIIEFHIRQEDSLYFFFRVNHQLYLYKLSNNCMLKILLPRIIIFMSPGQSLYNLSDFVYCRSKIPYCILFKNGVQLIKSTVKFNHLIEFDGTIYSLFKGHLVKAKIQNMQNYLLSNGFLINEECRFNSETLAHLNSNIHNNINHEEVDITMEKGIRLDEDNREKAFPKHMINAYDCLILSFAKYVPFEYHPFIPMVHLSDGPDGKPHSEPINKEEAEFVNLNPLLRGRTYQYFIELYSLDYKLMSSFQLNENEVICDMKLIIDNYLFVCTSFPEGEDKAVKGRVIVYLLIDIVPDPVYPHIYKKLKLISTETFKNACTKCEELRGLLALCVGTRLMIYEININTGLTAVGRNEIALLCTSLFVTKNFFAVSDIYSGLYFYFLRPKDPLKMHLLARSGKIFYTRFVQGLTLTSGNGHFDSLSLLAYDKFGNISIYTYSPDHPSSNNSNSLIKRASINTKLGYPIWTSCCHQASSNLSLFITNNIIVGVKSIKIQNIQVIHQSISIIMSDKNGINPKNYLETDEYQNMECKNIITEKVLLEFFYLSPNLQDQVCKNTGLSYLDIIKYIEMAFEAE